jgi:hypothetical protein
MLVDLSICRVYQKVNFHGLIEALEFTPNHEFQLATLPTLPVTPPTVSIASKDVPCCDISELLAVMSYLLIVR